MGSNGLDPRDLRRWLRQYQRPATGWSLDDRCEMLGMTPYELNSLYDASSPYQETIISGSTATRSIGQSSTFSRPAHHSYDQYSVGHESLPPHNPPQQTFLQQFANFQQISQQPLPSRYRLWCEFWPNGCTAEFAGNDTDGWIQHHLDAHLGGKGPKESCCWFCEIPACNFYQRMEHIRGHIMDEEYTRNQMRTDYHMTRHLRSLGALSEDEYRRRMEFTELPPNFRIPGSGPSSTRQVVLPPERGTIDDLAREARHHRRNNVPRNGRRGH